MLFNSLDFAFFLPIVFALFWLLKPFGIQAQNFLLLIASYFFYGFWDWRFLGLLAFSSVVDYLVGIGLKKTENFSSRKLLLMLSICVNIGFLGFFKYYNFFIDSFSEAFSFWGYNFSGSRLSIVLPVGISFYTFQTLSYSIDVYKRKLEPARDLISFLSFVSFFPQLVAGPIERATNLLPQFYRERNFNYATAVDGLRQILWGLFKKIVVADTCAEFVNLTFDNPSDYSGITLILGAIFFSFQIYCDFSGYSDIAIGTAKLFDFHLMRNFAYPYFSRDMAEFWRRWHISLSTWFRDYVYIPLGGSRGTLMKQIRNVLIIFVVSGFWHGANWTFVLWGGLNALYFIPLLISNKNRTHQNIVAKGKSLPSVKELLQISLTFSLVSFSWIFFRSKNITEAFTYIGKIFSNPFLSQDRLPLQSILFVFIFLLSEWKQRSYEHPLHFKENFPGYARYGIYFLIVFLIFIKGSSENQDFIYFQF